MKRHLLALFCVLSFHTTIHSRIAFPFTGLEISCILSDRNNPIKEYTILILENDTARDTIFAEFAIPIYIQLEFNKSYVIEFSKPCFLERLILIDTKVPAGKERKRFSYEFEIDMPFAYNDTGMYAVQPVARIIYDSISGAFGYDEAYAISIGNLPQLSATPDQNDANSPANKNGRKKAVRKKL